MKMIKEKFGGLGFARHFYRIHFEFDEFIRK